MPILRHPWLCSLDEHTPLPHYPHLYMIHWEFIPHPHHLSPLLLSAMKCARGDALGKSMFVKFFKMHFSLHIISLTVI